MGKSLVILSGGQDSVTCLYWALKNSTEVITITFDYGQKHAIEIESAKKIAEMAKVPWDLINVGNILKGSSPLINKEIEVETYENIEALPGGLEKTFVPGRNILFLTVAANRAYIEKCTDMVTGVSQEDFGGYPDCRATFIQEMRSALSYGLEYNIEIRTPLIYLTKKETVELAFDLGENCWKALSFSHTCYNGQTPPCGKCHSCLLREKGFKEAGKRDPLILRLDQTSLFK